MTDHYRYRIRVIWPADTATGYGGYSPEEHDLQGTRDFLDALSNTLPALVPGETVSITRIENEE